MLWNGSIVNTNVMWRTVNTDVMHALQVKKEKKKKQNQQIHAML